MPEPTDSSPNPQKPKTPYLQKNTPPAKTAKKRSQKRHVTLSMFQWNLAISEKKTP
ncbi:hypothetical protein BDV38DRAFT_252541 [Aspergillus pseudotamarii]|uniref:Uncharacterized protein n=1 Tax=Aspergillus pseudotamarii TaxID=132259 RepID=A0A5N6SQB9_ASPPS|nr:uncharacterized protein BDV38DRAFT_252541 [Aspergillus pseudotamarii]KAE8135314.1 hypothetical protein BDV38DRAFT_252541 [Aspergillus pseudotamarii]